MRPFEFVNALSVKEALQALDSTGAVVKSGGVDLLDLMKEGIIEPKRLVNLRTVTDLRYIRGNAQKGMRLGPTVTLAEIGDNPVLAKEYAALSEAARSAATPQIRNSATLGGNLCQRPRCWYFRSTEFDCLRKGGPRCFAQDGENKYHAVFNNETCCIVHPSATAVALTALRARIKITNGKTEREVAIDEFFVRPETNVQREHILAAGELIVEVIIPPMSPGASSRYVKLREKQSFDWPLADAAVVLVRDGVVCRNASIVLGSAAPVPWRVPAAETFLQGKTVTREVAAEVSEIALRGAAPLRDNHYKIPLLKAAVRRAILLAAGIDPMG